MSTPESVPTDSRSGPQNLLVSLFALGFGHLALEVLNNFLPIVYPTLMRRLSLSYTQIGLVEMVHSAFGSFLQPLVGWYVDRTSSRWLGWISMAWLGIWAAAVGYIGGYGSLLACVALMGLSSAVYHPVGASAASSIFSRRPATATSVFSVAGSIGVAFSSLLVAALLRWNGARGTVWLLPLGLASSLLLWRYLPPARFQEHHVHSDSAGSRAATRDRIVLLALIVAMAVSQAWFTRVLRSYSPLLFAERGQSETTLALILFVISIGSGLGTVIGGLLSDRIGPLFVAAASWALVIPAYALYTQAPITRAYILAGLIGLFTGMTLPVVIVLANRTWSHRPALATGLVLGLSWGSGGLGVTVAGALADRYGLLAAMNSALVPAALAVAFALLLCILSSRTVPRSTSS